MIWKERYDAIGDFHEGMAWVRKGLYYGFVNQQGEEIIPCQFDDAWSFSEDRAVVRKNNLWGIIDKSGNWIVQPRFEYIWSFAEGVAVIKDKNLLGVINKDGKIIVPPQYAWIGSPFYDGIAPAEKNGKLVYLTKEGYTFSSINEAKEFRQKIQENIEKLSQEQKIQKHFFENNEHISKQ